MKKWPIVVLIVICLISFAILTDVREGPKKEVYLGKGIPIVSNDVVIDKLLFNPHFFKKNTTAKNAIIDFYTKQLKNTDEHGKVQSEIDSKSDNIATLNCHGFEPINLNYTPTDCMVATIRLMKQYNISILALQEVPIPFLKEFHNIINHSTFSNMEKSSDTGRIYHTIDDFDLALQGTKEDITNVVLSLYPIDKEKKLLLTSEPNYIFRHRSAVFFRVPKHPHYGNKLFCVTHLESGIPATFLNKNVKTYIDTETDIRARKNQLRDIMNYPNAGTLGPDILMGDFNFWPESSEYLKVAAKYKIDNRVDYTIPDFRDYNDGQNDPKRRPQVDYIWFKKNDPNANWSIRSYAVNYIWSDHRPVIGIYKN